MPATLGFALILALMGRGAGGDEAGREMREGLIWLRQASRVLPYGPGLADLGLDPAVVTILSLADDRALLRAALDSVRAGAVGAVMLELAGRQPLLDLTATRRLLLSAAETGTFVLLVRSLAEQGLSAAHSRWRVRSAPSRPLAAGAPGHPVFDLTLLRQRGGREGLHLLLEWNRDTVSFSESGSFSEQTPRADAAALSGGASAVAAGGERNDPQGRAA